jgi:hypothetical protein
MNGLTCGAPSSGSAALDALHALENQQMQWVQPLILPAFFRCFERKGAFSRD